MYLFFEATVVLAAARIEVVVGVLPLHPLHPTPQNLPYRIPTAATHPWSEHAQIRKKSTGSGEDEERRLTVAVEHRARPAARRRRQLGRARGAPGEQEEHDQDRNPSKT